MQILPTFADIEAAAGRLRGLALHTPMLRHPLLDELTGGTILVKPEPLQRTGSFKLRGALNAALQLPPEARRGGVVTYSSGNHAQATACAAQMLGMPAVIAMPADGAVIKRESTRRWGAEITLFDRHDVDREALAARLVAERGATFIPPFDHPHVIAGQGTLAIELVADAKAAGLALDSLAVCTGGGGLVAGIGVAVKALRPDVRVVAVQAATAASYPASLAAGQPLPLDRMATMADGIAVARPGDLPFALVRDVVDEVTTVSEAALSRALLFCLERAKLVVEPAGAAAVAAVLEEPTRWEPPVVAVVSGGNVDPVLLGRVIQHGMVAAGRYLSVRVRIGDRPGELAALLGLLAELGANVLDVEHSRTTSHLDLGEVEVALSMETRGEDHRATLLAALRAAEHDVRVV
jgi:threonine dehydratase